VLFSLQRDFFSEIDKKKTFVLSFMRIARAEKSTFQKNRMNSDKSSKKEKKFQKK